MRRRTFIIVIVVVTLLTWWLWPESKTWPIVNAQPRGTSIIAFGDSLTAGQGAGADQSYPAQLGRRLGVDILNMGVSRENTIDALARLELDVMSQDPRIVLLEFGANDSLQARDINETFENLRTIIERIQQAGALVIVIGVALPRGDYGSRFEALARQTGCPLVPDLLDGMLGDREIMADGIHPNGKGYAIVADRVEAVLRPYIGEP